MAKVPFKVSARAARLIGRENVSNAEAAVIELVKNSYDADANSCLIFIENTYPDIPIKLSQEKIEYIKNEFNNVYKYYTLDKTTRDYKLNEHIPDLTPLYDYFMSFNNIYILDDGSGMSKPVIEKNWMTIGTNNKENNFISEKGRIRTGAKGIGRFALDRLGRRCEMWTLEDDKNIGFHWVVKWEDFEKDEAVIDDVFAELNEFDKENFQLYIKKELFNKLNLSKYTKTEIEDLDIERYFNGTFFKISGVRDIWNKRNVDRLYRSLDSLIPPKEERIFDIFLFPLTGDTKYGAVKSAGCDDYDYKLVAHITKEQEVKINIFREEVDLDKLDKEIFNLDSFSVFPFDKDTIVKKHFGINHTLSYFLPDVSEDIRHKLTDFTFTLYFLKRNYSVDDSKTFCSKHFNPNSRKTWLDRYGGIKIFRDHFRVRPYGDIDSTSFDWLKLSERVQKSTASIGNKTGAWKVRPNQVSGTINISRKNNVFEDKSSREGLQETILFEHLQQLIKGIIQVFELDRTKFLRGIKTFNDQKNLTTQIKDHGKNLAEEVIKSWGEKKKPIKKPKNREEARKKIEQLENDKLILAQSFKLIEESIDEKESELKLLRALAGTGIALTSLAHEIKTVSSPLVTRNNLLKSLVDKINVDSSEKKEVYSFIDLMTEKDKVLKGWLDVALNIVSKDKRTRKKIRIVDIFKKVLQTWEPPLIEKKITVEIKHDDSIIIEWRAHIIDIESILNNLIINSIIAFQRKEHIGDRKIKIDINLIRDDHVFEFIFEDSGPGLSEEIFDKNDIFEPLFSTNNESGTGLGLWIVKTIVEEYKGSVRVLDSNSGFKLYFKFPLRKGEGVLENV